MRLYVFSLLKKFKLMIFNQKKFCQAGIITMIMGFGMHLHANEVSQNEKNIEKVVTQCRHNYHDYGFWHAFTCK